MISVADVYADFVLTSMNERGELGLKAYAAGKHVLIEKPMATSLDEAAELVRLSEVSETRMVCAPHILLWPTYGEMHRRLNPGEVGCQTPTSPLRLVWSVVGEWLYQPAAGH